MAFRHIAVSVHEPDLPLLFHKNNGFERRMRSFQPKYHIPNVGNHGNELGNNDHQPKRNTVAVEPNLIAQS